MKETKEITIKRYPAHKRRHKVLALAVAELIEDYSRVTGCRPFSLSKLIEWNRQQMDKADGVHTKLL